MAKKKQEILDLSNKGLKSISRYTSGNQKRDHVLKLILDDNQLSSLEGVESFDKLIQLLCRRNRLFDVSGVPRKIVMINFQNNSIVNLHGFHGLVSLQWLCLAGNSIKDANVLNSCTSLTHIDLSDNFIKKLPVLTNLTSLKTLLLHGNGLKSLAKTRVSLPSLSLHTLTLAENGIVDLNEFVALQCLKSLEQLSVMGNASTIDASVKNFDFACRCFILYWSPQLDVLDGSPITEKERFTSWTLFLDYTHYPFSTGQHKELMEYLSNKCSKSLSPGLPLPINNENLPPPNQESFQDTPLNQTPIDSLLSSVGSMNVVDTLKALQYVQDMIDSEEKLLEKSQPATFRSPLSSKSPLTLSQSHSLPSQPSSVQSSLQSSLPSSQSTLVPPHSVISYSPPPSALSSISSFHVQSLLSSTQSSVPVTSVHQPSSLPPTSLPPSSLVVLYEGDKETSPTPCYYPSKIEAPPNEFIAHPSSPTSMSLTFKCAPPSPQNKNFSFYLDPRELKAIVTVQSLVRGFLCRKRNVIEKIRAAILIQSTWRGYYARRYDSVVIAAMEALYKKKVEGYIVLLVRHLQGCREELAHQVHMNQIQEETLKSLLLDVEELNRIKKREERVTRTKAATIIQRQWRNHKVRSVTGKKHIALVTSPLLSVCLSLQTQVNELKRLVSLNQSPLTKKIVLPPPQFLKMSHYSQSCLLLEWSPPDIESVTDQGDVCPPFLGCRIYVDGELEGMLW
ncbi:PREDICTED: centrosomal protein of 97 kDa-like isoform X2 [Amphimedon queenslandica]|uniref:Uncharacterized protein n=1 Tax=Amphimedon queenslandica TaxID=400682 RepID=A0AAN0J9Q8_AMPQE|nr:PREDICTED: centrosomal protein of 97 kDa-like isoform X2 [Amphimedon queenslandica]|eukprot:XP_019853482.1 PREDICTED: centrosomal protein of 97 kDa-like isoform X2 [Amphimedon queenslandica]